MATEQPIATRPDWRQIGLFVGVTFFLTYLLDLSLYLVAGGLDHPAVGQVLQLQMLIPAAVAITLQLFVFRDSPISRLGGQAQWAFYIYLAVTVLFVVLAGVTLLFPNQIVTSIAGLAALILSVGGLLLIVLLRLIAGREAYAQAGLRGGQWRYYLLFGLALVLIYGAMTALNALFGLGRPVDVHELLSEMAGGGVSGVEQIPAGVLMLVFAVQNLLLAPFLGLLVAFGEEYGWRSYLQSALTQLGRVRGVLLVGIIWGLWHAPIIAMGYNYPGYPLLGILLMTIYTVALAFFLGYAVLKSGSVWLAAYLHALNNATASFLMVLVYQPASPIYSFGLGIYGLAFWAVIVAGLLVLDRETWFPSPGQRVAATEPALESDQP